jgi:hypothetical protein
MNPLDMMIAGYQNDDPSNYSAIPQQPQADPTMGGPGVLDLLNSPGPSVPSPQADTSMLPALALLHFAASVSQPRGRGQSTLAKVLESGAGSASYAMNEKRLMEDRAMQKTAQEQNLQKNAQDLENSRVSGLQTRSNLIASETKRPMELEALRLGIEKARGDVEINAFAQRLAALKEKYAEQEIQAGLEEKSAKTDSERADAAMRRAHAQYYQKQVEEYDQMLKTKQKQGSNMWEKIPADLVSGAPPKLFNKQTGETRIGGLTAAEALNYATAEADAKAELGEFKKGDDKWKMYRNTLAQKAQQLPQIESTQPGGDSGQATPSGQPAPSGDFQGSADREAMNASLRDPKGLYAVDLQGGVKKYYIGGKEVSKQEADRRLKKPGVPTQAEKDQQGFDERNRTRSREAVSEANYYNNPQGGI